MYNPNYSDKRPMAISLKYEKLKQVISNPIYNTGDNFFNEITQQINTILEADYTLIGIPVGEHVIKTLSIFANGKYLENISYDLRNTSCEFANESSIRIYPSNVREAFPDNKLLDKLQIEGYARIMLFDSHRQPNGILISLFKNPIPDVELVELTLMAHARQAGAEIQHQQMYRALELEKNKSEQASRLKSEFISNLSHEVRTPLNGIIGIAEILDENATPEELKEYAEIIKSSSKQLLRIVDDVVEISKLETKKIKPHPEPINVHHLLTYLVKIFTPKAREKGLSIYLKNPQPSNEAEIITDGTRLNKILGNLIENAIKYTPKGHIELSYTMSAQETAIFVRDTGIGIRKQDQDRIFDRFWRSKSQAESDIPGIGLGLALVKENVALLQGTLSLESKENIGSCFIVKLPNAISNNQDPLPKKQAENATSDQLGSKLTSQTILVAEDEEMNYRYIQALFKKYAPKNFNLVWVKDGLEAIRECTENEKISLVLMDLKMPQMDGCSACERIKEQRPHLPIIAQTAYTSSSMKERAQTAGCDAFIAKPLNKNLLFQTINQLLTNSTN